MNAALRLLQREKLTNFLIWTDILVKGIYIVDTW